MKRQIIRDRSRHVQHRPCCDDDPVDDTQYCGVCLCGEAECGNCARCINPGMPALCGNTIDDNCDGEVNELCPGIHSVTASDGSSWDRGGAYVALVIIPLLFVAVVRRRVGR